MRTDRQTENSITEATLISLDCQGEQANRKQLRLFSIYRVPTCMEMPVYDFWCKNNKAGKVQHQFPLQKGSKNKQANSKYRSLSNKIKYLLYFLCWARTATTVEIYVEIKNPNPKCTYFTRPGES